MAGTTANSTAILAPATVAALFVQPLLAASVAAQVAATITISTKDFRIPRLTDDPNAAWVAEGSEITPSDISTDEVIVTPSKVAGLSIITRELADDSSPEAAQIIGDGLARDCARRIDAAFFGAFASPAPAGLGSLTGASGVTTVSAGSAWTNADPFVSAIFEANNRNASIGAWVTHPDDALALATLKQSSSSNIPLLTPDPTAPTRSIIHGLPLLVSTAVASGTVWGIPKDRALLVVRDDTQVDTDRSAFFTSDRVAIRATARIGFAFPQPPAIVKIVKGS